MEQDQLSKDAAELLEAQPNVLITVDKRTATPSEVLTALSNYGFDARISFGVSEDVVIATLSGFGLVASGRDVEAALDELTKELVEYAQDYFSDFGFYQQTTRANHLPWLLRFALTSPARRVGLLTEEPGDATILTSA